MSKRISKRMGFMVGMMQNYKNCVDSSTDKKDLQECRTNFKKTREERKFRHRKYSEGKGNISKK